MSVTRDQLRPLIIPWTAGDDPPRDRTSELRELGYPTRNLGSVQMTTDTAVGVTKAVVGDKSALPVFSPFVQNLQPIYTVVG